MAKHSLSASLELSGEWWLPQTPGTRLPGSCRYSTERVELRLHDSLVPVRGAISATDELPTLDAIHGASTTSEAVTLLHSTRTAFSFNFGTAGFRQPATFVSSWLALGAHVDSETLYSSARFEIPGLETWLAQPTVLQSLMLDEKQRLAGRRFDVLPPQSETTFVASLDSALDWTVSISSSANSFSSLDLRAIGSVTFRPNEPKPISWFMQQQGRLTSMLSYLAGCPMPIDGIAAKQSGSEHLVNFLTCMRRGRLCNLKSPNDFLLPKPSAGAPLNSIVGAWFREIDSVSAPSDLTTSVLSSEGLWIHVEFASLMQALEGFHRGRFPGNYMDVTAYEEIRATLSKAISATLSSDHKESLKSRIRYGNQISLSRRMNDLRKLLGDELAAEVLGPTDRVPRQWIDTRNFYAHWDEELRVNCVDGQELYNANVRLEHFIRCLFLLLMGVPAASMLSALRGDSGPAQQLLQLNLRDRHRLDASQPTGVFMTISSTPVDLPSSSPEEANTEDPKLEGPAPEGNA